MAGYTKVPDKKTIVAIVIIAVLLIAAIVGTVVFLKNRGTTEATDLASYNEQTTGTTQEEQPTTTDTQEQSGEPATQSAEEQATEGTEPATTEPTETADTDTTTTGGANQGTAGTGATGATGATGTTTGTTTGGTGTTTTTDNIQETTISREETVTIPERLVAEGEDKIWSPRELQASFASAYTNIENVQTPDITVTKTAITQSGSTLVQPGEIITYAITVQNNTNEAVEGIYVRDKIPDGTKYVSSSANADTSFLDENGEGTLRWIVDIDANGTTTVEFTVRVNDDATGTISNVAIANGEESNAGNPIEHSVITVVKANTLESETVKPGDTFDYTITVTNTGDIAGTVKVTDEVPGQLEIIETDPTATVDGNNVDFGEVTVPAEETITLTISVKVKADATGTITNTAIVNGEEVKDPEDINTVNIKAEKRNTLAEGVTTVKPGDTFAYEIELTNSGNTAGTVPVTDEITDKLEVVSTNPTTKADGSEVANGNMVDFGNVTVEPGTPVILTINVRVSETATGTIENTAIVDGEEVDDPETINTVNIKAEKRNTLAEGVTTVKPGDTFAYEIELTNSGNTAVTVTVTDEITDKLEVVSTNPTTKADGSEVANGNMVDFGEVTVEPGTPVVLTINVRVSETATGTIENTAIVDGEEVDDPETINTVNIKAEKRNTLAEGVTTVKPGDTFAYEIELTNSGNTAGTVTVTDEITDKLEVVSTNPTTKADGSEVANGNMVDFGEVTVEPGTPVVLTINVRVSETATGTIENTAIVDGEEVDDPETINTVNIKAEKRNTLAEGVTTVKPGDTFAYEIELTNSGNTAGTVTVTDEITDKLEVVSTNPTTKADGSEVANGNMVDFGEVTVEPGTPVVLTINVRVSETATGTIENTAIVDGEEVDDPETINTVNIKAEKRNTLAEGVTTVKPGDTFAYEIELTNSGNTAGTVTVTDEITDKLEVVSTNPTTKADGSEVANGNMVDFGNVTVEPGTPVILTINVRVSETATGTIENTAIVDGEEVDDPETINTVNIKAEKRNTLAEGVTTVKPGDTFAYEIELTNSGNTAGTVTVTDEITDKLEVVSTNPTTKADGSEVANGNMVDFGNVTVEPGTPVILTINVRVSETATGTIENTAIVDGEEVDDPETINTVNIKAEKRNTLAEGVTTVKPGDTFAYEIELTNSGNTAGTVTVTDEITDKLEVVSTNPTTKADGSEVANGNMVDFGNVTVEPGTPVILTINVRVSETATGTIENTAIVDGEEVDDPETINTVNIKAEKRNTLAEGVTTVKPGDTFAYEIELTNSGNTAGTVTVTDEITDKLEVVSTNPTTKADGSEVANGNMVDFGEVTVEPGTPTTLTINVKVKADATGTISNTAYINGEEPVEDPDDIPIDEFATITARKLHDEDNDDNKVKPGDEITYTITLSNRGNIAGTTTISDRLQAGIEYVDGSATNRYTYSII